MAQPNKVVWSDLNHNLNKELIKSSGSLVRSCGEFKEINYCQLSDHFNLGAWFSREHISKKKITMMNRIIANHAATKAHFMRMNIRYEAMCDCGGPIMSIDHLLFECPVFDRQRAKLREFMSRKKVSPTLSIQEILIKCDSKIVLYFCDFIIKNNICVYIIC